MFNICHMLCNKAQYGNIYVWNIIILPMGIKYE